MARQKRTCRRKRRQFGRLPVSVMARNAEQFITRDGPSHVQAVAKRRRELGQERGSCEYVPLP